jgi:hypothetical protein
VALHDLQDDRVGLRGVSAQWTWMPFAVQRASQLGQQFGQFGQRPGADRPADGAQLFELVRVGEDQALRFWIMLPMAKEVAPQLLVAQGLPDVFGEIKSRRFQPWILSQMNSAMCCPVTGTRRCCRAPVMFIRQPQSPPRTTAAPVCADVGGLVGHHGGGDFRLLDGEGPAEAAALVLVFELQQGDIPELADEGLGILDHPHFPQCVAGGVPGDRNGCPAVLQPDVQDMHQKLGQLEDASGKFLRQPPVRVLGEKRRIVAVHHTGAGPRGHDDRVVLGEQVQLFAGHGPGFVRKPGVVGRLAAAGLGPGVDDAQAFALQQADGRHARIRVDHVHQAGSEEIDRFRFGGVASHGAAFSDLGWPRRPAPPGPGGSIALPAG